MLIVAAIFNAKRTAFNGPALESMRSSGLPTANSLCGRDIRTPALDLSPKLERINRKSRWLLHGKKWRSQMGSDLWEQPVEVTVDCGDHFKSIRNCRDAIAYMMTSCPSQRKTSFSFARRLCLKAIDGRAKPADAAAAFKSAANDAGLIR